MPVTTNERIAASAAADSPIAHRSRQPAPKTRASASRARPLWRGSQGPPSAARDCASLALRWTVLKLSWVLAARWTACRKLREHPRRAISRARVGTNSTIWDRISLGSPFIRESTESTALVGAVGRLSRLCHALQRENTESTALVGAVGRLSRLCHALQGADEGSNRCPVCFFNELSLCILAMVRRCILVCIGHASSLSLPRRRSCMRIDRMSARTQ